jgi:hypothetical protein
MEIEPSRKAYLFHFSDVISSTNYTFTFVLSGIEAGGKGDRTTDISLGTPAQSQFVRCECRMDWSIIERNASRKPIALATRPQHGLILGQHFNKTNSRNEFEFMIDK